MGTVAVQGHLVPHTPIPLQSVIAPLPNGSMRWRHAVIRESLDATHVVRYLNQGLPVPSSKRLELSTTIPFRLQHFQQSSWFVLALAI